MRIYSGPEPGREEPIFNVPTGSKIMCNDQNTTGLRSVHLVRNAPLPPRDHAESCHCSTSALGSNCLVPAQLITPDGVT